MVLQAFSTNFFVFAFERLKYLYIFFVMKNMLFELF